MLLEIPYRTHTKNDVTRNNCDYVHIITIKIDLFLFIKKLPATDTFVMCAKKNGRGEAYRMRIEWQNTISDTVTYH